jgi:predicted hydrocarbon binding protein
MTDDAFYYPNRIGRVILQAMEQAWGPEQLAQVLQQAGLPDLIDHYPPNNLKLQFPFEAVSGLQAATEALFGEQDGRQALREVGRRMLGIGLAEFEPLLGITDLPTRHLPTGMKLRVGFDTFAMVFNRFTDQRVALSETSSDYLWIIERCPVCWGRRTQSPCCHLAVGILEEGLRWVSNGRLFAVEEIECVAAGGATCTIRIGKVPLSED